MRQPTQIADPSELAENPELAILQALESTLNITVSMMASVYGDSGDPWQDEQKRVQPLIAQHIIVSADALYQCVRFYQDLLRYSEGRRHSTRQAPEEVPF